MRSLRSHLKVFFICQDDILPSGQGAKIEENDFQALLFKTLLIF